MLMDDRPKYEFSERIEGRNTLRHSLSFFHKVFQILYLIDYRLKGCMEGEF